MFPRFTLKVFKELYKREPSYISSVDYLCNIDHLLIDKAELVLKSSTREKIKAIDDNFFWKIKTSQYRGALYIQGVESWIVSSGLRREGDFNDPYLTLERICKERLTRLREKNPSYKQGKNSDSDFLLPTVEDYARLQWEKDRKQNEDNKACLAENVQIAKSNIGTHVIFDYNESKIEIVCYEVEGINTLFIGVRNIDSRKRYTDVTSIFANLSTQIDPNEYFVNEFVPGGSFNSINNRNDYCIEFWLS